MTHSTISQKNKKRLYALLASGFWLLVWQVGSMALGQEILLVSPVRAVVTLWRLLGEASFHQSVLHSFGRILAGFSLAAALGVLLAVAAMRFSFVGILLSPLMNAIKATPVASFVILALIWIPSGNLSVFISFLMVLPMIYVNVCQGIRQINPQMQEMSSVFQMNLWQRLRAVYLPSVFPYFLSACAVSLGMSWKAGVAAEVIGLPKHSIGEALYQAKIFFNTPELYAWTLAILLISILFERMMLGLINRLRRIWEGESCR